MENYSDTQTAWDALLYYLNDKTCCNTTAYVNNGKRTFNTILNVAQTISEQMKLRRTILAGNKNALDQYSIEDLFKPDWQGKSAFHWHAVSKVDGLTAYIYSRLSDEQLQLAFTMPINLRGSQDHGKTTIHLAVEHNDSQVLEYIMDNCLVNDWYELIHLALRTAAKYGKLDAVKMILSKDPDVLGLKTGIHYTPLMEAAAHGQQHIVQFLLDQHCDANVAVNQPGVSDHNATALDFADNNGHKEIAKILLEHGAADTVVNQLRQELKRLIPIIRHYRWAFEGWGIFSSHTPHNIEIMRTILTDAGISVDNVDMADRDSILDVAKKLRKAVMNTDSNRSAYTIYLYTLVSKLGHTTKDDFDKLTLFTPLFPEQPASCKIMS